MANIRMCAKCGSVYPNAVTACTYCGNTNIKTLPYSPVYWEKQSPERRAELQRYYMNNPDADPYGAAEDHTSPVGAAKDPNADLKRATGWVIAGTTVGTICLTIGAVLTVIALIIRSVLLGIPGVLLLIFGIFGVANNKKAAEKIDNEAAARKKGQTPESAVSVTDELKKYKELLDMGVITQEDFDAKKKQLLGL